MKSTKVRGNDVPPFGAAFSCKHKPGTDELAKAQFYGLPVEGMTIDGAIHRAILNALDGKELNKGSLTDTVKKRLYNVSKDKIGQQIDWLAGAGKILMTPGNHNAKNYSLPNKSD